MKKIKTIFKRDWEGNRKCINDYEVDESQLQQMFATEKIDGTNICLTIRSGELMRVEKRRNPSKEQKERGIVDPWYVDVDINLSQDKWIVDAVNNTNLTLIPDGRWSAEAFGKNIQGNPLGLDKNMVFVFGCPQEIQKIKYKNVPTDFEGLKNWLVNARSFFNPEKEIEGIVWHDENGNMFKMKKKDFVYENQTV